jgi:membrane protein YqaA with SNARE-associated domain
MKTSTRMLLTVSLVTILGSMATCFFGVRYAKNQIPPELRARMADTDWVGFEWIERGMYLFVLGVLIGLIPVLRWLLTYRRSSR